MGTKSIGSHGRLTGTESLRSSERSARSDGILAAGGLAGAVAASSCCIVPLALFSVGAGGAWIGKLTSLAPYQWLFVAFSLACLGAGFYMIYRRSPACAAGQSCARPVGGRIVKTTLWSATVLVVAAIAFPYVAPSLLGG